MIFLNYNFNLLSWDTTEDCGEASPYFFRTMNLLCNFWILPLNLYRQPGRIAVTSNITTRTLLRCVCIRRASFDFHLLGSVSEDPLQDIYRSQMPPLSDTHTDTPNFSLRPERTRMSVASTDLIRIALLPPFVPHLLERPAMDVQEPSLASFSPVCVVQSRARFAKHDGRRPTREAVLAQRGLYREKLKVTVINCNSRGVFAFA